MLNKYSAKVCGKRSALFPKLVNEELSNSEYFEFTYKQGKGKFKIDTAFLIVVFNQTEFKKVADMIATSEDPKTLAGYLNSLIKKVYIRFDKELQDNDPDKEIVKKWLLKRNETLVKMFEVSPLTEVQEVQETEVIDTANEIMTDLKRCNVNRLIPTQVNPLWKNCKVETKIGYQFEYRGMPLQVVTDKGWISKDTVCKVFIIDPVIGLPVSSYDGTLAELENKLSEVFINYLKTIESNKEAIVQLATAFNRLTAITKIA